MTEPIASVRFRGTGFNIRDDLPGGAFYAEKVIPGGTCPAVLSTAEVMQLLADLARLAEKEG